ncbi:MAG: hypothetical protein RIS73_3 [Bacteroidota bacterium]|jgi:hypothetical protein
MAVIADKKSTFLIVRMKASDKTSLKILAKQRGITVSKLVLSCLANKSVPDFSSRLKLLEGIGGLVKEMNAIGNNINQLTIAIHQIKHSRKIAAGEYLQLIESITKYRVQEQEIKMLLNKLMDHESGI